MRPHNEIVFENDIVKELTNSIPSLYSKPYLEGKPENYNAELDLYTEDLLSYLKATQQEEVEKVAKKQGADKVEHHIAREIARYIDSNGCLHSLRRGVEFVGSKFQLVQFKPDNFANQKIKNNYDANILRVVRQTPKNISYFAFTATPKSATLQTFGRLRFPDQPKSKENTPIPFHLYTMKQAIEEGFILDVLKNYITYDVAYRLVHNSKDKEVDSQKAKTQISKWVRLHPHNISQKIAIIIEHYNTHVKHMLNGTAKAMVITGSRKEAVRYKIAFDKYIKFFKSYTHAGTRIPFFLNHSFLSQLEPKCVFLNSMASGERERLMSTDVKPTVRE